MLFLVYVCYAFVCVCLPAGKGLTAWLSFVMSYCEFFFLLSHWFTGSSLVLDCIDF